jgi:hypothetical protein
VRVKLALRNALESEAEFAEAHDADEQLLALLRNPPSRLSSQRHPSMLPTTLKNQKPGKRTPGRDSTGLKGGGVGRDGQEVSQDHQEGREEEQAAQAAG